MHQTNSAPTGSGLLSGAGSATPGGAMGGQSTLIMQTSYQKGQGPNNKLLEVPKMPQGGMMQQQQSAVMNGSSLLNSQSKSVQRPPNAVKSNPGHHSNLI